MDFQRFREDPIYQALWIGRVVLAAVAVLLVLLGWYLGHYVFEPF